MRGRAGAVPEISVGGLEICLMNTSSPGCLQQNMGPGIPENDKHPNSSRRSSLAVRMASSCIACCVFHIISIPFNCSDTALRVTDAKIGPKVKIFVFRYVCFVSQIWRQNSYPGSLTFSHLGNRAKISHMNPRQNSSR